MEFSQCGYNLSDSEIYNAVKREEARRREEKLKLDEYIIKQLKTSCPKASSEDIERAECRCKMMMNMFGLQRAISYAIDDLNGLQ